jgi:hypothetical protein
MMMPLHPDLHLELARQRARRVQQHASNSHSLPVPPPEQMNPARELRLLALFRHFDATGKEPAWPCA